MIIVHTEAIESKLEGTIIDLETTFDGEYGFDDKYHDSRRYQRQKPVIFGYINRKELAIHCARRVESIPELKDTIIRLLPTLEKPWYAFNCDFEIGVLYHSCGISLNFDGELDKKKFESKGSARNSLGIENYDDPFFDDGLKCKKAWNDGKTQLAIRHNSACLLKERDIFLKRGFRKPDELSLYPPDTS